MTDLAPWQVWAALVNIAIALDYAALGLYIAPKFEASHASRGLRVARFSALVFFVTCAMTHTELALHVLSEPVGWMGSWHFLLIHTVQALAAPAFLVTAARFSRITIRDKRHYQSVLDQQLAESEAALRRMQERSEGGAP